MSAGGAELETTNQFVLHYNVDSSFNLSCSSLALPASQDLRVAWYFNNIPLCLQDCISLNNVTCDGSVLLFSQLTLDHAGWYTCAVANGALARKEIDFLVVVQGILSCYKELV